MPACFKKKVIGIYSNGEAVVDVIVWLLDLQLPMQSVAIATKVSSNPAHVEVKL